MTGIDAMRGVAVLLMIVDHVAAVSVLQHDSAWAYVVNHTFGRLAMPLFFILMGAWYDRRGWSFTRWATIAGCGLAVSAIGTALGFAPLDVLLQISGLVLLLPFRRWPLTVTVLGFLQAVNWPLADWPGYQPGLLAGFFGLGLVYNRFQLMVDTERFDDWHVLAWFGRHALALYVGHFVLMLGMMR